MDFKETVQNAAHSSGFAESGEDTLTFCDEEEEYLFLMADYIRTKGKLPWKLRIYTNAREMLEAEKGHKSAVLLMAESVVSEETLNLDAEMVIVLGEEGVFRREGVPTISKYQAADEVLRDLMGLYAERKGTLPRLRTEKGTGPRIIGLFSPIRRCLQTTFALTLGQMLAENNRVLYLSFEHFSGLQELGPMSGEKDLADLLYFAMSGQEAFRARFETMVHTVGNLDYISPMKSGQNLLTIQARQWQTLLDRIGEEEDYDFVVLDLSESMQGLLELLRRCETVYTMTKDDRAAKAKILQYEQILELYEYADIKQKTRKLAMPRFQRIPSALDCYTRGELAEYVRERLRELEGENGLHGI